MRAIEIAESTPKITLGFAEVDQPRPGPGQILIAVHAAGVTRTELNWYPSTHTASGMPRLRVIPGHEFSGVVAAFGEGVRRLEIGRPSFGKNHWVPRGAMAEYCL